MYNNCHVGHFEYFSHSKKATKRKENNLEQTAFLRYIFFFSFCRYILNLESFFFFFVIFYSISHIYKELLRPTDCLPDEQTTNPKTKLTTQCAVAVSTSHVSRALLYDFLLGCDDIEFERESQSNRVEKRGGITTSRQVSQSGRQTEEVKQRQNRKRTEEDDGNDLGVENNSR